MKERKFGKTIRATGTKILAASKKAVKAVGTGCGNVAARTAFKIYSTL